MGFASLPGEKDADGKFGHFVMVDGQGISISHYSAHKDEAWKFLEWFMSQPQQWKWVEGSGVTRSGCHFKSATRKEQSAKNRAANAAECLCLALCAFAPLRAN